MRNVIHPNRLGRSGFGGKAHEKKTD
ncbi:hypothetical protein MHPYR_440037 [uncultured Mycobacterium sp.]|uniref:Uncharacterized protein n=1 Tax=uncultured Mycobacterium sp. TaxID=171292 RepID=A0A1Y5PFN2_9MYCO|nr:hypothetical protein MHPYR_440037 [uncultured Mycobacterium sp.]